MRITDKEVEIIKRLTRDIFGEPARAYLFGSRVDDGKRGGDIDLCIVSDDESVLTFNNKISFLVRLKQEIGDQKIDLVFDNESTRAKVNFYNSIVNQRIRL